MQADVSLVGWAAPATAMTDRTAIGPTVDETADDAALVTAALAGVAIRPSTCWSPVTAAAVYQVCYRFVNQHEDAADLTQDTFVRAWKALASFRGQARFSTWLHRIAVNVCLNRVAVRTPVAEPIDVDALEDRDARRARGRSAGRRTRRAWCVPRSPRCRRGSARR